MSTTEFEIKIIGGRITNIVTKKVSEDVCKVVVETEVYSEGTPKFNAESFVLVEASKLSLEDEFMKHEPQTDNEKIVMEWVKQAIKKGVRNFYHPTISPSFADNGSICFDTGKKLAEGMSYEWWEKEAKDLCPERGSRLGTIYEYFAFVGVVIKDLISEGWSVNKAWHAVCDNLRELSYYWDCTIAKQEHIKNGKPNRIWAPFDLSKSIKILSEDKEENGFWMVGIDYHGVKNYNPFISTSHISYKSGEYINTVGWIVLSK